MNYIKGSEWRKWDLHVHTPSSIVQYYGEDNDETWDKYINDLEKLPKEIKVLGINDYLFVDGYEKVKEFKKQGRLANIDLLLPVIEFRIKMFAGVEFGNLKRINLHVIFSDEIEIETIRNQFLTAISPKYKLTKEIAWNGVVNKEGIIDLGKKIIESVPEKEREKFDLPLVEGFNNLNINIEDLKEVLENSSFFPNDKYIIGIGKTEWDELKWTESSIADKKSIFQNADIVFTASENEAKFNTAREKLLQNEVNSVLFDCSDAHHFSNTTDKDRIGNCMTWIKSDTTFEGLKYAINDYLKRVYISNGKPDKDKLVSDNKTKYIKKIEIKKNRDSTIKDIWFNNEIVFNNNLVAIIGNKGNGKSALGDIIAFTANSQKKFSFLTENRFKNKKSNLASNFSSILTFESGDEYKKCLNDSIDLSDTELVKYIPQSYLEDVCNEINAEGKNEFNKELSKVIFSHIPIAERLGYANIDDLIKNTTITKKNEKEKLIIELKNLNRCISEYTEKISEDNKKKIISEMNVKKSERDVLLREVPIEVKKPNEDPKTLKIQETIFNEINVKVIEKNKLISEKENVEEKLKFTNISITKIHDIISSTSTLQEDIQKYITNLEIAISTNNLNLNISDIVKVELNIELLTNKLKELMEEKFKFENILNDDIKDSLAQKISILSQEIIKLTNTLNEPNKKYQDFENSKKEWDKNLKELNGDKNTPKTIYYYESELEKIKNEYPNEIKNLENLRMTKLEEIYIKVNDEIKILKQYYVSVQNFIDSNKLINRDIELKFDVNVTQVNFKENFIRFIDASKKGSFQGIEAGQQKLIDIINKSDFNNYIGVKQFIDTLLEYLIKNKNLVNEEDVFITTQLKKDEKLDEMLNYIFSLEYLSVQYELKLGNKSLSELSPGEKGLLLLIFYLLIDKEDIPLIIDQPEENLDNETITKILVPCINEARRKRQLIIITHNPNLAVVCDAEQIIYCEIKKNKKNEVIYDSGSLENPKINKYVTDILEGTMRAFRIRDNKYQDKTL